MNRNKQIDSLRGIAVILVILHHSQIGHISTLLNYFPIGANVFMVLSGYLITSILLREKERAHLQGTDNFTVYKNFIVKRALRIFPLYYITLLLIWILGTAGPYQLLSFATFTSNFYLYHRQEWLHLSHTWSLSVQEHFYLLWPLVLLLTPKKAILPVILSFIGIGVISQKFIFRNEFGPILTPSCFDALGTGALLAWIFFTKKISLRTAYKGSRLAAFLGLLLFIACLMLHIELLIPFRTVCAIFTAWLLAYILYKGEKGLFNKKLLLNNPALHFIGKISFGLYLFHPIIPGLFSRPLAFFNSVLPDHSKAYMKVILLAENYLLMVLVAWAAYRFIELPFLKLKKYFSANTYPDAAHTNISLQQADQTSLLVDAGSQNARVI